MKILLHIFLLFIIQIGFSQETSFKKLVEAEAKSASKRIAHKANINTANYDISYHKLEFTVDPNQAFITGIVTTTFTAKENMNTVTFDLADNMIVTEVSQNGAIVSFSQNTNDELVITLAQMLLKTQETSVKITYSGNPKSSGFGSFEQSNHNGSPIIWTLSEPYGAKGWWPCKQDLNDKIDAIDVYITAPKEYVSVSNGMEQSAIVNDAVKTTHFKHQHPIPAYLIAIAVTNYTTYSHTVPNGGNPFDIVNYVYPEDVATAKTQTPITVDIINLYSDLFEEYPYADEKYGHAQFGWGGGMEHTTVSFMKNFSRGLIAHELAHQWFGDNVTAGSWSDIWLNEGFASYAEELMLAEFYPGEDISSMLDRHANVMEEPGGSVWVEDSLNVGRIFNGRLTYNKGAAIIHTLRYLINNDDLFFETLQNYQTTFGGSTAILNDFKSVAETVSGLDLTAFFNEWYYGQGYPTYSVEYSVVDGELIVLLEQSVSMPSETPFFTNDLTLRVQNTDGDFFNLRLTDIDGVTSYHSFDFVGSVTSVSIDPENWIINQVGTITENNNLAYLSEEKAIELSVYPNPTVDFIHITDITGNGFYTILNTEGKTVLAGSLTVDANKIDVEDLPNGQYFIQFNGGKTTFTKL